MIIDTEVLRKDIAEFYETEDYNYFRGILVEFTDLVTKFPKCIDFADANEIDLDKLIKEEK